MNNNQSNLFSNPKSEVINSNFQLLFNLIDDPIIIANKSGEIKNCNIAAIDKLGYTSEKISSLNIRDLCSLEKSAEFDEFVQSIPNELYHNCNVEIIKSDGNILFMESKLWFGTWDKEECIYCFLKDITKEREELYRFTNFFNKSPIPTAIIDFESREFFLVNESFSNLLGLSHSDLNGKYIYDFDIFSSNIEVSNFFECFFKTDTPQKEQAILMSKLGRSINVIIYLDSFTLSDKRYIITTIVDITELKNLEIELSINKNRLENIINGANLGTWEWNIKTGETIYNNNWAEMLGYKLSEFGEINHKIWENLVHPEDHTKALSLLEKHFRGESPFYSAEIRMKHKDGRWVWILDQGQVISWQNGKPLMMFGIQKYIDERKRIESELYKTKNFLALVIENIPSRVFWKDRTLNYLGCNTMFAKDAGFEKPEDIIGKNDYMMVWSGNADIYRNDDREVIQKNISKIGYEEPGLSKDGDKIWLRTNKVPLKDADDNIIGVLGSYDDITEKKKILEKIVESEEKFRLLFEYSPLGILVTDREGNIIDLNKSILSISGSPSIEEIINLNVLKRLPFIQIGYVDAFHRAVTNQKTEYLDGHFLSSWGREVYVKIYIVPVKNLHGKVENVYTIIEDITSEKEYENEIKKEKNLFSDGPVVSIIWEYKDNWPVKYVSSNVKNVLGFSQDEMLSPDFKYISLIHTDDIDKIKDEFIEYVEKGINSFNQSYRVRNKYGQYLWIYDFTMFIKENSEIKEIRGYFFDQTEIKEVEDRLRRERERLRNIIQGTNAGTWEWNIETGSVIINQNWAKILGYTIEELSPISIDTWKRLTHPDDIKKAMEIINNHFQGKIDYYEAEIRMKHKDGRWVWILDRGKITEWSKDKKPLMMYGFHIDINERKLLENAIKEISIKDPLTEVFNRRYLFDRLNELFEQSIRTERYFAIAILDIDYFKEINDKFGHQAGDFILKEFTKIIAQNIRPYDTLGRYGGEEFLIIFPEADKSSAKSVILRILNIIKSKTFTFKDYSITFTFSAGIADSLEFEKSSFSIDNMILVADKNLYFAKNSGRKTVI